MALIKCPECGSSVSDKATTCPHCGVELKVSEELVCPVCHRSYPAGTTFCSADGSQLVPQSSMTPTCVICGTQYPDGNTKFCPQDGGAVVPGGYQTPSGAPVRQGGMRYQKANLGNRFLASLLDGLIAVGLSIPAIVLYVIGLANIHTYYDYDYYGYSYSYTSEDDAIPFFIIGLVLLIIPMIYAFIKDGLGNGQSWGKKALKLKVICIADSSKCTKGRSALRCLIGNLLSCIPFIGWLIEPIMVLATSDGRRLADKVAGTMVVNA